MARVDARGRVLDGLAAMVAELAAGAALDARLLDQQADRLAGALRELRQLGPASAGQVAGAVSATSGAAAGAAAALETTTGRGAARAAELLAILRKEIEEKGGPPPDQPPGQPDPGGVGPTRPRDEEPGAPGGAPGPPRPGGDRPLPGGPGVVVGEPRVRRCYRFTLTNRTNRDVSDLTFDTSGGPASVTAQPAGWTAAAGPDGFRFDAGSPAARVPPGRQVGPFEFCREGPAPLRGRVALSHPDGGPVTPLGADDIRVRGRRPATDAEGNLVIPPARRQYVHEVTVRAGAGGQDLINVELAGARVRLDGDDAVSDNGTADATGRRITVGPRGRADFLPGTAVTVRVVADRPIQAALVRT